MLGVMTDTKGQVGRPALPAGERKDRVYTVRLRGADGDLVERAAQAAAIPTAVWLASRAILAARNSTDAGVQAS